MPGDTLQTRRAEFEANVWDHAADPFQMKFDTRRPLTKEEMAALKSVVRVIRESASDEEIANELYRQIREEEERVYLFLQIAGLTRNKILQDLKGAAASRKLRVPSTPLRLHTTRAWTLAGPYLAARLGNILQYVSELADPVEPALEALNQATWPGWIRQERAKRQGHEAEARLATVLMSVGLPFEPREKADNPLCRDAQVNGISFDVVVPNVREPLMVVKSTVHTANIGQYGQSKDALEITEAANMTKEQYQTGRRPLILAMIDGVGFRSNRQGLDGVLETSDEFCQFKTVWKAVVVAAAQLGQRVRLALPKDSRDRHAEFFKRYEQAVEFVDVDIDSLDNDPHAVEAGEGFILTSP